MKLGKIGLPNAHGTILFQLWRQDGIPQHVLAQPLSIRSPTATRTLQKMQLNGRVERRRDEADHRVIRVHLTEKAKALGKKAGTTLQEIDQELMSVLTDQQRDMFMEILSKICRYLTQTENEIIPFREREQSRH